MVESEDFGGSPKGLYDDLLVQLAIDPVEDTIVVKLDLDEGSDEDIKLTDPNDDPRFDPIGRTITFDTTNWDDPVLVRVEARDDARREDLATAVIAFRLDPSTTEMATM